MIYPVYFCNRFLEGIVKGYTVCLCLLSPPQGVCAGDVSHSGVGFSDQQGI